MGEIDTVSHRIENNEKASFNSGISFFEGTASRERFKSNRFKELALDYATDTSNREASKRLNRIRLEEAGVSPTTYRNMVEREGLAISAQINEKCEEALECNGFDGNGALLENTEFTPNLPVHIDQAVIEHAAIKLDIWDYSASDYEAPNETVNISIDEVCVKRQSETRPANKEKKQGKRVNNTVIHVQSGNKSYILNAVSILNGFKLLVGFLLLNGLLGKQIVIFADGAREIHSAVLKMLSFANCKVILDWYHLEKKCKEYLSMALKGRKIRNEFLEKLLPCLWVGDIDEAIKLLQMIDSKKVKNYEILIKLIEYLQRVRNYVPCYTLRKELGLRNSSNLGEKSNDIIVSNRQKHNGMSWSNDGSAAFASVSAATHNLEIKRWVHSHEIKFELIDAAA